MALVMRLLGMESGGSTPFDGQYLVDYDPDTPSVDPLGNPMDCHLATTSDITKAKRFVDLADVHREWCRTVADMPHRIDGRPNRPLTAFSITTEPVP